MRSYIPDVPFVPTPYQVVKRMLRLVELKPGETLYDLGAGDGRILFMAAQEFNARAVGIEIRRDLVERVNEKIKTLGLEDQVRIIHGNFFDVDISEADVVTLYLLTSVNEKVRPKLERELRPGARVVSHDFEIPGWRPNLVEEFRDDHGRLHRLYLYRMPPLKKF